MAFLTRQPKYGLVRVFTEFSLIPELLALVSPGQQNLTLGAWHELFLEIGINIDHLEDEDVPKRMDVERYMAEDVWQLLNRIGLILPNGRLSDRAQTLVRLSERGIILQSDTDYIMFMTVSREIEMYIWTRYRGTNGLRIIQLLQNCARALEDSSSAWIALCPGLLLVEIQYLIEIAHTDVNLAERQVTEMVAQRDRIMQDNDMPAPTPGNEFDDMLDHSDKVTNAYLTELARIGQQNMTLPEVRSTAMLLVYAELLDYYSVVAPVQCLIVPRWEE